MKLYMIRNPEGFYSTGGVTPRFNARGKIWRSLKDLRKHLHIIGTPACYLGCVIKEFEAEVVDSKKFI